MGESGAARWPRWRHWAAAGLFVALTLLHTWPIPSSPGRYSRNDNADTVLNEWTLAWVAHQLPRDPLHLFDANIFHPDRDALAYSEHLFVPALMGAPLFWAGATPTFVYNVLLMAGFCLTALAGYATAWRWTRSWPAALVAGALLSFNAHTLTRMPHLQAIHAEFVPLFLLALDGLFARPRAREAALVTLSFVLVGLTSNYLLVMVVVAAVVATLARADDWWPRRVSLAGAAALAGAGAVVALLPFLLPYRTVHMVRPLDEVAYYSAHFGDYLLTPSRLHFDWWSHRFFGATVALFPGGLALVLAVLGSTVALARGDRRARMLLAVAVVGIALSFGPALPGYETLYRLVPIFQGIRVAARFGYLALVSMALLAAFGVAFLEQRLGTRRGGLAGLALVGLVTAEVFAGPVEGVEATVPSPLYATLRRVNTAVVAELPFWSPEAFIRNARYMPGAMSHWKPMLNGYSGLVPPVYEQYYRELKGFPDAESINALRRAGVTHIFVHEDVLREMAGDAAIERLHLLPDFQFVQADGALSLFAVTAVR